MNQTIREIKDQYHALGSTIAYLEQQKGEIAAFFKAMKPRRLLYIGCGSSYSIGCSAAMSARRLLGIEAKCLRRRRFTAQAAALRLSAAGRAADSALPLRRNA